MTSTPNRLFQSGIRHFRTVSLLLRNVVLCFSFVILFSPYAVNTHSPGQTQKHDPESANVCRELYYVDIHRSGRLNVADDEGHRTFQVGEDFIVHPDLGITYTTNESGAMINLPLNKGFTITWAVPEPGYLYLNIVKGCGNIHPTESVRYLGRPLVVGTKMLLRFEPTGPQDLRYDKNQDGKYAGIIKPEFVTSGKAADDTEGPKIKYETAKTADSKLLVTLSATDKSGVYDLAYAFEGATTEFTPYKEPFTVDPANIKLMFVSSHDKVGNPGFATIPTSSDFMVRISALIFPGDPMLADLQPNIINGESSYSDKVKYSYDWDLGDGSPHEPYFRSLHRYKEAKSYTVTLTVTDNLGHKAQSSKVIKITPR